MTHYNHTWDFIIWVGPGWYHRTDSTQGKSYWKRLTAERARQVLGTVERFETNPALTKTLNKKASV